jgi:hypothetical protein
MGLVSSLEGFDVFRLWDFATSAKINPSDNLSFKKGIFLDGYLDVEPRRDGIAF